MLEPGLHDPQREVADPLELAAHPDDRHHQSQVGRDRVLAGQHLVAALGERHVHGVDVVVRADGVGGDPGVAGLEHLAHPLEVLVDQHAHHLDLQTQLLELGAVGDAQWRGPISRIGR